MNYKNLLKLTVTLNIIILVGLGCSSYQSKVPSFDELLKAETEQNGQTCIRQRDINGYGVLDDDVISVSARGRNFYLVTTMFRCSSLNTGFQAGFDSNTFEFCPVRDKIITRDEACPVKAIYEFNSRQDAFEAYEKAKQTRKALIQEVKLESQN